MVSGPFFPLLQLFSHLETLSSKVMKLGVYGGGRRLLYLNICCSLFPLKKLGDSPCHSTIHL